MMKLIYILLFCTIISPCFGQIKYLHYPVDSITINSEEDLLITLTKILKVDPNLSLFLESQRVDDIGFTHFQCRYKKDSIPFAFVKVSAHVFNDKLVLLTGHRIDFVPSEEVSITKEDAISAAEKNSPSQNFIWLPENKSTYDLYFNGSDKGNPQNQGELVYTIDSYDVENASYRLAYKFDFITMAPEERVEYYISAVDGSLVLKNSLTNSDIGTVETRYSGSRSVQTTAVTNDNYRLYQDDGPRCTIEGFFMGVSAFDDDNSWTAAENVNWTSQQGYVFHRQPVLDMYWGTEMFYDYFKNKHNWNSYNGADAPLQGFYYDDPVDDASWNGTHARFFRGNTRFTPLTSLDVVAHEFAHGIASTYRQMIYIGETGAINESLSDIWGACVENYADQTKNKWLSGEEISLTQYATRSFIDPNSLNHPDTYLGNHWITASVQFDNGGVHTNSSVMNHWFYLLSEGGSGTNDLSTSFNVPGIGIDDAAKIVFRAEVSYFEITEQFMWARNHTIDAARDLFGNCSQQVESVIRAWNAVGVGSSLESTNSLTITNNVLTNQMSYEYVYSTITASNKIEPLADASYETSEVINLKPGFHSAMGSNFHAQIVPCRLDMGGIYRMGSVSNDTIPKTDLLSSNDLELYLYPNPTTGNLKLNSNKELEGSKFNIHNSFGSTIQSGIIGDKNSEIVLDNLKSGLYFFIVELNGQKVITKIIKL